MHMYTLIQIYMHSYVCIENLEINSLPLFLWFHLIVSILSNDESVSYKVVANRCRVTRKYATRHK